MLYEDKATGTNTNRPQFRNLMQDAHSRQFDIVLVWKLDRMARSLKDLIYTLQELSELGVTFISLRDHLDLTTSTGRLMLHIVGAFAQFEADLIKERVKAGLSAARAKGTKLGRPARISHMRVAELRQQGRSLNQIARELGVTKSAVSKTLRRIEGKNPLNKFEITHSPQLTPRRRKN
jgi:DNA invertase Pin-like site-specific DNA recombinase